MRVLVLDGNQNQAVACVRSLARAGHTVLVGESASWSKASWSRFCRGMFRYPDPHENALEFVNRVAEEASAQAGTLVLPTTEATTLPLSAHREIVFAAGARMVLPDHSDLLRACNKEETTRLACSLGIRVPRTITVSNRAEATEAAGAIAYPVVLKTLSSEEYSGDGLGRATGRPRYARNPDEFMAAYRQISARSEVILVQEFVAGEGVGYFALMDQGTLLAEFAHRRIRDVYPSGSGSALRVSVEPSPDIRTASLAILQALRWHGAAMVEFRKPPGEPPVFLEVNGRLWHSLALACYSGADFPAWLAQLAERGRIDTPPAYRPDVRCRWLLGDFRHLIEVWRGAPAGYPERYPSRLATLLRELIPAPGTNHDNFSWRDPLPELGDWLSLLIKAAKRKSVPGTGHAEGRYSHP